MLSKNFIELILCKVPKFYSKLRFLYGSTDWEKDCFIKTIKKGWSVIEIGANEGYYTKLFSHLTGKSGCVHAFEPILETFQILESNIDRCSNRISLHQLGVSSHQQTTNFYVPKSDSGQSSLLKHENESWKCREIITQKCDVVKLDDFLPISTIPEINFIKIDVEGAELLCLQGAKNILSKHKPTLFIEVSKAWMKTYDYCASDLDTFLKSIKYSKFSVVCKQIKEVPSIADFVLNKPTEETFNFLIN